MAANETLKKAADAVIQGAVAADLAKAQAVKNQIDGYSKQLGVQLKSIQTAVSAIQENWESDSASQFTQEATKRIKEVQQENEVIDKNVESFLEQFIRRFGEAEKAIVKNADLFK